MTPNQDRVDLPAALLLAGQSILRAPGTSLHRQIFLVLRGNILRGAWAAGSSLPTEEVLGKNFGVSRVTVRRALSELAAQGLVERRHGLGTFVPANFRALRPDPTLDVVAGLRQSGSETEVRVLEVQRNASAPPDIAALLRLGPQELCTHAVRLRHIGDSRVMLTDAWVPMRVGRKITTAALQKRAIFELLLAQGVKFGRVVQEISAEAADTQRASLLGTELGAPLIRVVRLIHDLEARPVQYIKAFMSPERSRILMDISGEAMNTLSGGQFVHDGVVSTETAGARKKH